MKYKIMLDPKVYRAITIADGFIWKGNTFQIDSSSQTFIAAKALSIIKARLTDTIINPIVWRTMDNDFYEFTPDEFLEFSSGVEAHIESILKTSWDATDNKE